MKGSIIAKSMILDTTEIKFKASITKNITFEENQGKIFAHFGSKTTESDFLRFLLRFYFSQSVLKSHNDIIDNIIASVFVID